MVFPKHQKTFIFTLDTCFNHQVIIFGRKKKLLPSVDDYLVIETRVKVLTPDHYTDFAIILSSCEDVISAEVPLYLEKIASLIKANSNGNEFCNLRATDGLEWIKKHDVVQNVLDEFLNKHGHRSLNEFEVMEKSWCEDPTKLIPMIQANVKYGKTTKKEHQSVEEISKKLITPKKSSTRRAIKFLMKKMQIAVGRREQTKSEIVKGIDKLREAYRVLGRKLVTEGYMPNENLIYHLTQYEIRQLITNRNPNLVTKASRREKLFPKWCSYKYPEISFGAPVPENSEENDINYSTVNCVSGTPVCSGTVKARACVIDNLMEIDQLQKGDILITYSTDIGWSPYFPMISGIVTELGGLVSHGAVVAREYGLPSIVGVKNVTKFFKTGDVVILNGDKGELAKIIE